MSRALLFALLMALVGIAPDASSQVSPRSPALMMPVDDGPEDAPPPAPPPPAPTPPAPDDPPSEPVADGADEPSEEPGLEAPEWDTEGDHAATLEHTTPEPEPEPEPEPTPEPSPIDETVEEASSSELAGPRLSYRPTLLAIGMSAGLLYHRLRYHDDLYGFMRPYSLQNAKELGGYIEAYPFAVAVGGVLGRVGVDARYVQMVALDSARADGSAFPTRSRELLVGLRVRMAPESLEARGMHLGLGLGGGGHTFEIQSAVALPNVDNRAAVPSRHYRFLRLDLAGRFALDLGFFITLHAGFRGVFDAGEIDGSAWFPRSRRMGIESGVHLGYVLPKGLEVAVGFEAQRYFYDLRPRPGDPNIAGGLIDRFAHVDVRVGWRY